MAPSKKRDLEDELEKAAKDLKEATYVLKLYIAGFTPRSAAAIESVKQLCEEHLKGRYELEVIDVSKHPKLAKGEQIIAAPTLIKSLPLPLRRLIGSMANREKVLVGLDLRQRTEKGQPEEKKDGTK
jgi:circadian clock protein KaiB